VKDGVAATYYLRNQSTKQGNGRFYVFGFNNSISVNFCAESTGLIACDNCEYIAEPDQ
jgi:hypothetical protein